MQAQQAVDVLTDFVPLPDDLDDHRRFIAALVAMFDRYPSEVMQLAADPVRGVPSRLKVLRIASVKEILDEINAPFAREQARQLASQRAQQSLPPPRRKRTSEEQARIDAQVADARAKFGPPAPKRHLSSPRHFGDGKHAERVAADLARRKAMRGDSEPLKQSDQ